ncbi:hypothetical protein QBC37DRAFT_373859 [Rhypophila decipiens]|uniref:Uncharacterized protein n=1 Tax=Rhypophila decipiens TaxID=261697 RepID=A0AAN6Y6Z8_9PEZI|nr:hypothetical protein QBC37DRAFT_373859 [Rhypophila decipiens]
MGFRERIGLKSKSSSANLSAGLNNGANGGYGFNASPQQNMYSIPESGFASGPFQQQHQYQQAPRTAVLGGGIPMASRPGPQPSSFEANRSASSGSTYSFSTNNGSASTTSFNTTSTGTTTSSSGGFGAGIRNFSGNSAKSGSTAKGPVQQQQDPQITAADVRRCTKLLRQMFELHLELWTLTYTHGTDQYRRHQKRMQVEAILVDIHNMVGGWHAMPPSTWTEEEHEEIKWIAQTLADLPPPPY